MKLADLTREGIESAISAFYTSLSAHVAEVVFAVSRERYSIPRERRRLGPAEFPYYFAADLDLIFRFAVGEGEASASHVDGLCTQVLDVLHCAPAGRVEEDWRELSKTALGLAIKACRTRIKLRDDDALLTSAEVVLLSDLSPQKIAAARLKSKRRKGTTSYPAPEVRALFIREGIAV